MGLFVFVFACLRISGFVGLYVFLSVCVCVFVFVFVFVCLLVCEFKGGLVVFCV